MFCSNCGMQTVDEAKFCSGCGSRLEQPILDAASSAPGIGGNGDVVMTRPEIHQTSTTNIYQAPPAMGPDTGQDETCPICHRHTREAWFHCPECKRKYICVEHQDPSTYICHDCMEMRRRETAIADRPDAEQNRKREEEDVKAARIKAASAGRPVGIVDLQVTRPEGVMFVTGVTSLQDGRTIAFTSSGRLYLYDRQDDVLKNCPVDGGHYLGAIQALGDRIMWIESETSLGIANPFTGDTWLFEDICDLGADFSNDDSAISVVRGKEADYLAVVMEREIRLFQLEWDDAAHDLEVTERRRLMVSKDADLKIESIEMKKIPAFGKEATLVVHTSGSILFLDLEGKRLSQWKHDFTRLKTVAGEERIYLLDILNGIHVFNYRGENIAQWRAPTDSILALLKAGYVVDDQLLCLVLDNKITFFDGREREQIEEAPRSFVAPRLELVKDPKDDLLDDE